MQKKYYVPVGLFIDAFMQADVFEIKLSCDDTESYFLVSDYVRHTGDFREVKQDDVVFSAVSETNSDQKIFFTLNDIKLAISKKTHWQVGNYCVKAIGLSRIMSEMATRDIASSDLVEIITGNDVVLTPLDYESLFLKKEDEYPFDFYASTILKTNSGDCEIGVTHSQIRKAELKNGYWCCDNIKFRAFNTTELIA